MMVDKENDKCAPIKYKRNNYFDARKADENIKYCKICRKCWEIIRSSNTYKVLYYEDFPTYKKEREVCSLCTNK